MSKYTQILKICLENESKHMIISEFLINLNDEGKIMGKKDYRGVLGWGEVN